MRLPTSQEFSALCEALLDDGTEWGETDRGLSYTRPRDGWRVDVELRGDETHDALRERLLLPQCVDTVFVYAYCLSGLLPSIPADSTDTISARFSLREIARSCGLLTDTRAEECHAAEERVFSILEAGARCVVSGTREYRKDRKRHELPVSASIWRLQREGGYVDLTLSGSFAECLATPGLMQYVSGIDGLAKIPAGRFHNKIARALGLRVLFVARLGATKGGSPLALQRREWITAWGGPAPEAVTPNHRDRYRRAYYAACAELAEPPKKRKQDEDETPAILTPRGDAAKGAGVNVTKGWEAWLSEEVCFSPGELFRMQFRGLAERAGSGGHAIVTKPLRGRGRPQGSRKRKPDA